MSKDEPKEEKEEKAQPAKVDNAAGGISPFGSVVAIAAGFFANFVLSGLSPAVVMTLFPSHFPVGDPPMPDDFGLVLTTGTMAMNGLLSGLLCGRFAPVAPVPHAAVLAGIFGMFGLTSMDQVRGYPGWFAVAFAAIPPLFVVVGGSVAKLGIERRKRVTKKRGGTAESVSIERDP